MTVFENFLKKMVSGSLTVIIYVSKSLLYEGRTYQHRKQKKISVNFYGKVHVCEAMVIVVRFVDDNWHLPQVVRLMLLAKSL